MTDLPNLEATEQRLVTQSAVSHVLAEAETVRDAALGVLRALCKSGRWEYAAIWTVDDAAGVLRCADVWHRPELDFEEFKRASLQRTFSLGVGHPGRIWASGQPAWIPDLAADDNFPRQLFADAVGLRAGAGFPIVLGRRTLGVIELLMRTVQPPDPPLLDMMAALGRDLGQFIQRKHDEEALRDSERRKAAIVETALDCIITIDSAGRIIEFNPAAERTFGYRREDVLGELLAETIIPPRYREAHRRGLARYLETGIGPLLGKRVEITGMRADRSEILVELAITAVQVRGEPHFTAYLRDITERKRSEETLQTSERRFRALIEKSADGIVIIGPDGRVIYASPAIGSILGYTPEEFAGRSALALVHREDVERVRAQASGLVAEPGGSRSVELRCRHLDGTWRWIDCTSTNLLGETGIQGVVINFRDITERKRSEEEIQQLNRELRRWAAELVAANQELEAFSYTISHDLRAPLRAINGFAGILLAEYAQQLDAEGLRVLGVIRKSTLEMDLLLQNLLEFSRLSRQEIASTSIDMTDLARSVTDGLRRQFADPRLEVEIKPLLPARGDATLLRQVLMNLTANAFKFTRARAAPRVEIGSYPGPREHVYYVKDNGIGFDMRYAEKLFGVFQRLHAGQDIDGTGVGLAIVKRIIERHGGRVWAEGVVDGGATFYFSLPSQDAAPPAVTRTPGSSPGGSH